METTILFYASILAATCVVLWVTELIPLYATTLLLWIGIPILLGRFDPQFELPRVLVWAANPVVALFLGGFALSVAGQKYGIDNWIASFLVKLSGGRQIVMLANVMFGTAVLSMWMSNIAAAAMMIAALNPLLRDSRAGALARKAILLAIAFGANRRFRS